MCPMTTTIMAETCSICAGSLKWAEYPKPNPEESDEPSSWGEIIYDKGADTFKKEEEDPFDPNNW